MKLYWRYMKGYKKNTFALLLCFLLTIALMECLLVLIHTNHRLEATKNMATYSGADLEVSDLSLHQLNQLKKMWKYKKFVVNESIGDILSLKVNTGAMLEGRSKDGFTDNAKLLEGRLPHNSQEVVAERWTLANLGVKPKVNESIPYQFDEMYKNKKGTLTVVGILSDITVNKEFGYLQLYTVLDPTIKKNINDGKCAPYEVYIKFQNETNISKKITQIRSTLQIKKKQVRENIWKEDMDELHNMDVVIIGSILVIATIVFYGIYRITLMKRRDQFGILRAIGMNQKGVRTLLLKELMTEYVISIPFGILLGMGCAYLVTGLSNDRSIPVYMFDQEVKFTLVTPLILLILCVVGLGMIILMIGVVSANKVCKESVICNILGLSKEKKMSKYTFCPLKRPTGITLGIRYLLRDKKTSLFVMLSISLGCTLFYGLWYRADLARTINVTTKEMQRLNGQYKITGEGVPRTIIHRIAKMPEVKDMKTMSGSEIKIVDQPNIKRNDGYLNKCNKKNKEWYGYPLIADQNKKRLYHSKMYGYNVTALKRLKHYIVEGEFDPEHLNGKEIIVSMYRTGTKGSAKGFTADIKEGIPIMQYQVGDQIQVKYRQDHKTDSDAYMKFQDRKATYETKTYRIAAIVYFSYMDQVNAPYPVLITSDHQYQKIWKDPYYQHVYVDGRDDLTPKQQERLEQKFIQMNQKEGGVVRSVIREIKELDMYYHKELVYVYGVALVTLILVLVNVWNTLRYRIQTRRRDIAIYQAVGMKRTTIRSMIYFENVWIGVLSLGIAYGFSHPLGRYLYGKSDLESFKISYAFNGKLFLIIMTITIILCLLLSWLLTRNKREEIVQVIDEV